MATVTLTVTPTAPNHGDTLTATYAVAGNDGTPPQSASITGDVTVGSDILHAVTTVTLPAVPPLPETFDAPTCPGLSFQSTPDPHVWTALVP